MQKQRKGRVASESMARAVSICLAGALVMATVMAAMPGMHDATRAYAASSGKTSVDSVGMERYWGSGEHSEKHLLKVDGDWVYCMQGGKTFEDGMEVTGKDPVKSGKLSQKCVTDLALAYEYVWVHDLYRKPSGKKLQSNLERYAATQVLMWHILLKYGEDDGPSHSSISIKGEDITGDVDETSNNKKAFNWIADNRDDYIGYCTYYAAPGAQDSALGFKTEPKLGAISLEKHSSQVAMTDGNSCYSLKGAVYGVFDSQSDAQTHNGSKAIKTYNTDASGRWESGEDFKQGTYYVAETAPSPGYKLDDQVYKVEVKPGKTVAVNGSAGVAETPVDSPFEVLLAKWDADLNRAVRQGAATLEGAEFTVSFYAGHYGESDLPKPKRSWVLRTDASGLVSFANAAKHKVSGSDFFKNESGQITMPLGTVSVVETKAPRGYNLGEPKTFVFQVVQDSSSGTGASQRPINYSGAITESNTPVVPDTVQRGDYRLVKEVPVELSQDEPQAQERVLMKGIEFQIINDNDGVVISPETGEEIDCGGVVCTIRTDENGLASTRGSDANGWSIPEGWTAALAYGTYWVHEVVPDKVKEAFAEEHGHELIPVEDWKITISDEGQYDGAALVNNRIPQSALKVVKVDAETKERIPAPMRFQLYDADGELVTYTARYPEKTTIDTWVANERGEATLPMLLEEGSYTLQEVEAPEGYVLNADPIPFTVDDYRTWDEPLEVVIEDMPIKGIIEIEKADMDTGAAVAGAQYIIVAASDIVTPDGTKRMGAGETAAVVTTDDRGHAASPELYLGPYTVYEAKSPAGYALDRDEHSVTILSEGQDVPVVKIGIDLEDAPTTLRIVKVDAVTDELLPGAKFRIWGDGGTANGNESRSGSEDGESSGEAIDRESEQREEAGAEGDGGSQGEAAPEGSQADASQETDDGAQGDEGVEADEGAEGDQAYLVEAVADDTGIAELPYLVAGTYHVAEIEAPAGHYIPEDSEQFDFVVDDQGLIGLVGGSVSDTLELKIGNPPCEIGTTANVGGFKRAHVSEKVEIVDTVKYKGCKPGETYTVTGTLHKASRDDDGNKVDAGCVMGSDGAPLTVEVEFAAQSVEGSIDVVFRFDASGLEGAELVAFEEMRHGSELFAVHADIEDEDQTVYFEPELSTTLVDKKTGNHTARIAKKDTLVDTVEYKGLRAGQRYTLVGTLVNSSTGEPLRKANGSEVTAKKSFTCEHPDGKVNLAFKVDSRKLAGSSAVAYETLYEGEQIVAVHADLSDAAQTVTFPTAKTSAADKADGDKAVKPDGAATVVDAVTYTGLTPGQKYEIVGTMHAVKYGKNGKREDGGVLKDAGGKAVTARKTFKPKKANGTVEVEFSLDAGNLNGTGAVVFEEVRHIVKKGKSVKVVSHADIEDADQYVKFGEGDKPLSPVRASAANGMPQTGDDLFRVAGIVMGIGVIALGAALAAYARFRRNNL